MITSNRSEPMMSASLCNISLVNNNERNLGRAWKKARSPLHLLLGWERLCLQHAGQDRHVKAILAKRRFWADLKGIRGEGFPRCVARYLTRQKKVMNLLEI